MLYHGTIVFEVPYKGKWYRIDALHAKVSLYEETDVPAEVANRAVSALVAAFYRLDDAPDGPKARSTAEEALRGEFGDARFVSDTVLYGVAT